MTRADLLLDHTIGDPDGAFVIAEWTDPGCPPDGPQPIAPLHRHHICDEAWYVLEGALVVQLDDQQIEVLPGAAAYVPKGVAHTFWNPNPEPARYLLVMTSKTHQLISAIHTSDLPITEIFALYDAELV